jgi:hypothetical protein
MPPYQNSQKLPAWLGLPRYISKAQEEARFGPVSQWRLMFQFY